ncbi:hypothetical protein PTKIN_Ptkin02bG0053900 [Pterospermum kingtungense]
MAQIRKMDVRVEIKCQADKFYHGFKTNLQQMPKICSQVFKDVKLVQGDWNSVGSVREWSFLADGKSDFFKDTLEVDDKNKTLVFKALEGTKLLNSYKSWNSILNVTPKGEGSLVTWTMEYEKQYDSVPEPLFYIDFFNTWTKTVDAYLLNA